MKKVMRMWENKGSAAKNKQQKVVFENSSHSEADDFYVFIYDEDEKQQI